MRKFLTPLKYLSWRASLMVTALLAAVLAIVVLAHGAPPALDLRFGDTTIHFAVDRAWSFFPGDCVGIEWELEGIESLYIEGWGEIGWGEQPFCPEINRSSPMIEVRAQDGIYRQLRLGVHFLPDLLLYLGGFVGVVGSILLALYYVWTHHLDRPLPWRWLLVISSLLTVVGAQLYLSPTELPVVEENDGQVVARMWAENERLVFPGECVDVGWSVVGARSLRLNGEAVDANQNPGRAEHCAVDGGAATLEVITMDGSLRVYMLPIPALFGAVAHLPIFFYWSVFGLLLAALIFLPLAFEKAQANWRGARTDYLAIGGCAFVVLLLYLPFGFDSIAQLESWFVPLHFEGGSTSFHPESFGRFLLRVPYALAIIIDSESFVGFHLVHYALLTAKMALLYAILRQLNVRTLYAFLTAVLFMVYPVNSALLSLRSLGINNNMFWLLLATYSALDYLKHPRRLTFVGLLLALVMNVASYEAALVLIFVLPLFLWLRSSRLCWRNANLTIYWYLAPVFKIAYIIILFLTDRPFYESGSLGAGAGSGFLPANVFETVVQVISRVYPQTFLYGWQQALTALGQNMWWLPTISALAVVGGLAVYFARRDKTVAPPIRKIGMSLMGGLFFIMPAIGTLMWFPFYNSGDWRIYFYVSIGAAIVILSLVMLLTARLKRQRLRDAVVIALVLLLMLPAISRLFAQHNQLIHSADEKAKILYQILVRAPRPHPGVDYVMMTPMNIETMREQGISELMVAGMFDSAMLVLYQDHAPRASYICVTTADCSNAFNHEMIFDSAAPEDLLKHTLFFELRQDHTVRLIRDPISYLNLDIDVPYDASLLYDANAPLPPRAATMLGAALRE